MHRGDPLGNGLPRALGPRRGRRPHRLPALRAQRNRRARLHAAADGGADQGPPAGPCTAGGAPHPPPTGPATERGTFSDRHMALHDEKPGIRYVPIQKLSGSLAPFAPHNSPLSEIACLGFEYGYSAASPESLIL